jgi:hypothetical protein
MEWFSLKSRNLLQALRKVAKNFSQHNSCRDSNRPSAEPMSKHYRLFHILTGKGEVKQSLSNKSMSQILQRSWQNQ